MKTISVVSPCFNEESNVEICYQTVRETFARDLPDYRLEHIFVDNSSTDRTPAILRELAAKDPSLKVILNARNFGPFRSTFNGLRYATGDAVLVMLPVDLQDPPDLIPQFVRHWEKGIDIVAGARTTRQETFLMRLSRGAFYRIVNALSDFRLSPDVGEFQLIDRKVLNAVLSHNDHYPYIRGIIASCGFTRLEIPYTWQVRKRGVSKYNLPRLMDTALNGIFSFTKAPLRFCTLVGFAMSAFCILFALISAVLYLLAPDIAPRGITTLIVAVFFLSGVQMTFIGMLGEYVMAIHSQVRGGPMVIERERLNVDPADQPASPATSTRRLADIAP